MSANCAAFPETLLESELFGYVKGAFTGATQDKEGLFQAADGSTLFLDEVGAIPVSLQSKLLRAVELKEVVPVGSTMPSKVDSRILAATSTDLAEAVRQGSFMDALYFRLNVVEVHMPPLREHKQDIPVLVEHFTQRLTRELKKEIPGGVADEAMALLMAYDWPGNVRELENAIERAMILTDGDQIRPGALPLGLQQLSGPPSEDAPFDLRSVLRRCELEHIATVVDMASQDKAKAAQMLGISLSSLYRKLEQRELGASPPA